MEFPPISVVQEILVFGEGLGGCCGRGNEVTSSQWVRQCACVRIIGSEEILITKGEKLLLAPSPQNEFL